MDSDEKRAFLLLKSVIFHYHGLDEDEQQILDETAESLDAQDELDWAYNFIEEDYYTAFDRARDYLKDATQGLNEEKKLEYLSMCWDANMRKGYISEMEAMAILKLAKDWGVESGLMNMVRG